MSTMIESILGCRHRRTTFPMTPRRRDAQQPYRPQDATVVCLSCGQTFRYDFQAMRRGKAVQQEPEVLTHKQLETA